MLTLVNTLGRLPTQHRYESPEPNVVYDEYMRSIHSLVTTMTIKSTEIIQQMNESIRYRYGAYAVDEQKPHTWRWYCHVAGEYHPLDVPIKLLSLDTYSDYILEKETIDEHPRTKEALRYGNRLFNELLDTYPDQILYIINVINPIDKQKAIDAVEWEIINYDKTLVEFNEITLMSELQTWLYNYIQRFHIEAYQLIEKFYSTVQYGLVISHLVPKIINLRIERIKTQEVHSFHVRQHLASHQYLDRYYRFLTHKQRMFFYRNIDYIQRHFGHYAVFKTLVRVLLLESNIPVYQNYLRSFQQDETHATLLKVDRRVFDLVKEVHDNKNMTILECLEKQDSLAPHNPLIDKVVTEGNVQLGMLSSNDIKTYETVLRSNEPFTSYSFNRIYLDYFMYLGSKQRITTPIIFTDKVSNKTHRLPAHDLFYLFTYVSMKTMGVTLEYLPNHKLSKIRNALEFNIPYEKWLSQTAINYIENRTELKDSYATLHEFKHTIIKIHEDINDIGVYVRNETNTLRHFWSNHLYTNRYRNVVIKPPNYFEYGEWLVSRGIAIGEYSKEQYESLLLSIYDSILNDYSATTTVYERRKALVDMLNELTSYTIHILKENVTNIQLRDLHKDRFLHEGSGDHRSTNTWLYGRLRSRGSAEIPMKRTIPVAKPMFTPTEVKHHIMRPANARRIEAIETKHYMIRRIEVARKQFSPNRFMGLPTNVRLSDVYNTKDYRSRLGKHSLPNLLKINTLDLFKHLKTNKG